MFLILKKLPLTPKDKTVVLEEEISRRFEIDEDEREELRRQALEFYAEEGET